MIGRLSILYRGFAFAPDGRLFYTVKGGFSGQQTAQVWIIENGRLRDTPFLSTRVETSGERGLIGVALDPNFAANRYVYRRSENLLDHRLASTRGERAVGVQNII